MSTIIIGDVHGYFDELMSLFDLIKPSKEDKIYFLGDLIDRGPKSKEVLDFVKNQRYPVILGNHEDLLIAALKGEPLIDDHWRAAGGKATLKSFNTDPYGSLNVLKPYQTWIESFPLYLDLGEVFLVHAGVDPAKPLDQQNRQDFCWIRDIFHETEKPFFRNKTIVTGHTPTITMGLTAGQVATGPGWINIDTGVHLPKSGWLTALRWEEKRIYQVNSQSGNRRSLKLEDCNSPVTTALTH